MKTTENSETNESNKFVYQFTHKINVKNSNKSIELVNLSIYYTSKNIKSAYSKKNLKFQFRLGMINLTCLMDRILFQTFKIIPSK